VYDFTVRQYGKPFALAKYKGKVTVIVNVASE
jgi:glutathione peroxidase-family protein